MVTSPGQMLLFSDTRDRQKWGKNKDIPKIPDGEATSADLGYNFSISSSVSIAPCSLPPNQNLARTLLRYSTWYPLRIRPSDVPPTPINTTPGSRPPPHTTPTRNREPTIAFLSSRAALNSLQPRAFLRASLPTIAYTPVHNAQVLWNVDKHELQLPAEPPSTTTSCRVNRV